MRYKPLALSPHKVFDTVADFKYKLSQRELKYLIMLWDDLDCMLEDLSKFVIMLFLGVHISRFVLISWTTKVKFFRLNKCIQWFNYSWHMVVWKENYNNLLTENTVMRKFAGPNIVFTNSVSILIPVSYWILVVFCRH